MIHSHHIADPWPHDIESFLNSAEWISAKTYAKTWPHYYIVKDRVDGQMFEETVTHIREHGYAGRFYRLTITYLDQGGFVYWTMVPPVGDPEWYPVEEETIVNRCVAEGTYEYRLKHGTLPN